jgi:hypothetical protein
MEPGAAYVLPLRSDSRDDLVLVEPEPDVIGADHPVFCDRDEAGGHVLMVQMGDRPLRCEVTARRPDESDELRRIAALEQARSHLGFARRFLDVLAVGPGQPAGQHSAAVVALQQTLLEENDPSAAEAPARRHSGLESRLRHAGEAAATRWSYLSHRLLEELLRHLRSSPDPGITSTWWAPGPRPTSGPEGSCCYCGMTVRVNLTAVAGIDRRAAHCGHCGLLADTSGDVGDVRIVGPAVARQDEQVEYVLTGRWANGRGWHHLVGELLSDWVPWQAGLTGERTSWSGADRAFELSLPLRISSKAYPGLYFIRAAVVADGHLWMLRRPLTIERRAD